MTGGCPLCGAEHASCGQPSASVPVDLYIEEAVVGGPLKLYDVVMPNGVRTRMKLNDQDVKRYNASPVTTVAKARAVEAVRAAEKSHATPANPDVTRRGRKPLPRDADGNIIRDED